MPVSFDVWMRDHQISWRRSNIDEERWGWQNGRQYEWILPRHDWEQGLWRGIRSGTMCSLPHYLMEKGIQKHGGVHNLKSSWVTAANLYFPFRADDTGRSLLAGFLREYVDSRVQTVDAVELEYAEDGLLHPSILLGEKGGMRGAGQTSPDLAFIVNGGDGLVLTENKLVEHSFYGCSARTTIGSSEKPCNPDPQRCFQLSSLLESPANVCHQSLWGRKYWDLLIPIVNQFMLLNLRCCPAAIAGYQLFRQHALAEGIACSGKYAFVISSVALDQRNSTLVGCLQRTGIEDLERDWSRLFAGKAGFAVFTHQQWVEWVRQQDEKRAWGEWLQYVLDRYGY